MDAQDLLWNSTQEEIKNGYVDKEDCFICLLCGKRIEKGIVYPEDGVFYEAKRYMGIHIEREHQSVFDFIINMDKKVTGLSEHQSSMLKLFFLGKSDVQVQNEMGIGSSSTIRNHRFVLREKERQAKVFLVLMELLKENNKKVLPSSSSKNQSNTIDENYNVSENDSERIIKKYFPKGLNGPLKKIKMKEKSRVVVLREISKRFEPKRIYNEKEVNEILKEVYEDYVTLRRYLVEYGFVDRKTDGSQYWIKQNKNLSEEENMDRRKELIQQYKEMKTEAGVYQVRNTKNNRAFIISTPNLKTINGRRIELQRGGHRNKELQEEWNQYGEENFIIEVLEVLEEKEEGFFDKKDELKKLEKKWIENKKSEGCLLY